MWHFDVDILGKCLNTVDFLNINKFSATICMGETHLDLALLIFYKLAESIVLGLDAATRLNDAGAQHLLLNLNFRLALYQIDIILSI